MNGGAEAAGHLVGYVLILGLLVYGGVWLSRRMTASRTDGRRVRWPIWVAVALAAFMLLGQLAKAMPHADAGTEMRDG